MKFVTSILLCYTIASAIAADEHRPKMKLKDSERGKRNLEYSISHNYPIGSNFRLERRISNGPPSYQLPSRFPPYFPAAPRPYIPNGKRGRPHSVPAPPYAVQMEPLVQYSQRDPLYDTNKLPLSAEGLNDLTKPDDLLTDNNHLSENVYTQNIHGPSYGHHHHDQVYYQKEPEPIIEIIIKESNVTLPPVPVAALPPKKKEPVQVFYVKYKKNPNGHGKDSVIYDKPIPALTPHVHEDEPAPQLAHPHQEYVTAAPLPSTTIRTIIRPDSETFIGTSGIRVTFGSEHHKEKHSPEGHEESAPQPAVIFPQHNQHHEQQQAQFSQPIPERKPPTVAFPPNFNPPGNFNQQSFNPRPPAQFQNNQYRPVHQHQSIRQFPNQPNPRPPGPPPQRPFQSQLFAPRPLAPPQVPPQHRPFNQPPQFPSSHQFLQNHSPNSQFPPPNHQYSSSNSFPQNEFPPNRQFVQNQNQNQNQQFPSNQFTTHAFHHNFPQNQSPKPQFPQQNLNHRPQSHFPIVQQLPQTTPLQHFNQKPLNQPPPQKPQNIQFNQVQHHQQQHQQQQLRTNPQIQHHQQPQQQQSFQFHNQHVNVQHQHQINHQQLNHHQQPNQHQQQSQQQQQPQQQPLQLGHIIPPGGELLKSVPRYEQHISIPADSSSSQLNSNQGSTSQALPQVRNQQQNNHFVTQAPAQNNQYNNQQLQVQLQQQLQAQLQAEQEKVQLEQQQRNLQIQQQLKQQEHILQQQQNLSPQQFQQQIQQQFLQFPQNFAQLNLAQNKQAQAQQLITPTQKQENIQIEQSLQPQQEQEIQQSLRQQQQQHIQQDQQQQQQQSAAQNFFLQNLQNQQKSVQAYYQNNPSSIGPSSTTQNIYQSSTQKPITTTNKPAEKTEDKKKEHKLPANIVLPDEVPDDLREQLLSSGILSNAQISVLDYDKVGDIPIDALPPDQLANFYGAGGAQQLSASERRETFVQPNGEPIEDDKSKTIFDQELEAEASDIDEVTESIKPKTGVEMKVVHYDAETQEGKAVQESYVRDDATQVDPVVLNDNKYNRYLPLKVSGINFPIPDVPELKGRNITSVVVLAPVDYEFKQQENHGERTVRDIEGNIKDVRLLAGEALKVLIKEPTTENYNKWLERENQTASDKQAVVLLVTGSPENKEKEIFMYDVATKTVSKLSGELSSAFVEAAESNAEDEAIPAASEIEETRIKSANEDLEAETSEVLEEFIDVSANSETTDNRILVNSGYSKTG